MDSLLNLVLFLPILGALLVAVLPRELARHAKHVALGVAVLDLALSIWLLTRFDFENDYQYQFSTRVPWIAQFGIDYHVGVDGISMALVLLNTLLIAVAIWSSFAAITTRVREFYAWMLVLSTGVLGVFMARDLFLFYVFWELMLVPMYFLIGVWGGDRRIYATTKFVLYTLVGSLLMLLAILSLYLAGVNRIPAENTFDWEILRQVAADFTPEQQRWLFLAFALAFAIKVPIWPLHTWLPDAHVEAPTAGSVILAGVLLKLGIYGFIRYCIPLFPEIALELAPYLLWIGVVGIIYGALVALAQKDIKKLVAYSSVSHLGFCIVGLFAFTSTGVNGSILQMINHGLSTGALFLLVGMLYERRHTREISAYGGLWKVVPVFTAFFLITTLSSIGLPGLNGFVGEFLVLLGSWPANEWVTVGAATGVVLGAVYMLWMFQRVMHGPLENEENRGMADLNRRELSLMLPLIVLMFWIGIFPNSVLQIFDQAVEQTVTIPIEQARMRTLDREIEFIPPPPIDFGAPVPGAEGAPPPVSDTPPAEGAAPLEIEIAPPDAQPAPPEGGAP